MQGPERPLYVLSHSGSQLVWICETPGCGSSIFVLTDDGDFKCNSCLARPEHAYGPAMVPMLHRTYSGDTSAVYNNMEVGSSE